MKLINKGWVLVWLGCCLCICCAIYIILAPQTCYNLHTYKQVVKYLSLPNNWSIFRWSWLIKGGFLCICCVTYIILAPPDLLQKTHTHYAKKLVNSVWFFYKLGLIYRSPRTWISYYFLVSSTFLWLYLLQK